jgi:molecular chaperone HtpG
MFAIRKQDGLALYARKVLIQEYNRDLLPEYFRFVQGVVDSEDIPLSVSRESVQSNRVMASLKKILTAKVIDALKNLAKDKPDTYFQFWKTFGSIIKEGVAMDAEQGEALIPLLRYHTLQSPGEWKSMADYVQGMKTGQNKIYYLVGDDERALISSPHLEAFRRLGYDVILMAEPIDSFALLRMTKYAEFDLANASAENVKLPEEDQEASTESEAAPAPEGQQQLIDRFKQQLGERVSDVRLTTRLVESPARLVDPEGAVNAEMQRVYKMLQREFEAPKKVLEINPKHPLFIRMAGLPAEDTVLPLLIEQVYENALLIEGLHPNPAAMIARIQQIMEAAINHPK